QTCLSAPSRQDERDERGEIAMIHPALHDIGPALGDQACKLEQTRGNAAGLVESQLDDRDAARAQPFHMGLGGEKAYDGDVVGDAGLSRRKPRQHRLGTAASKTRRNIECLPRPPRPPPRSTPPSRAPPAASERSTTDTASCECLRDVPATPGAPARPARTHQTQAAPVRAAIQPIPVKDLAARHRSALRNPSSAGRSATSA